MTDSTATEPIAGKKGSKVTLILGFILCLAGVGGGFYATYSGLLYGPETDQINDGVKSAEESLPVANTDTKVAFLPIDPLIISLSGGEVSHLRFRAQLEVEETAAPEVAHLMPRVVDVLNSYLRAVELADLQDHASLVRLRAQMLRRVQVVTGGNRVRDLLIMEFVLN